MSMEMNQGSIASAIAVAALDRAEALDASTVALQKLVRQELAAAQTVLEQEAGRVQAILRQEVEVLNGLRQEVARGVTELKALQPGIERSAGNGVRNALALGSENLRSDLVEQVSDSAGELRDAAKQVKGMVKRLTPLWAGLIATAGLLIGILLMYFVTVSWQRRIEEKIDRLPQVAPVQAQPAEVPPPSTPSSHPHQKTHESRISKPKAQLGKPMPAPPATEQP